MTSVADNTGYSPLLKEVAAVGDVPQDVKQRTKGNGP
jgi:hypothetical protein